MMKLRLLRPCRYSVLLISERNRSEFPIPVKFVNSVEESLGFKTGVKKNAGNIFSVRFC